MTFDKVWHTCLLHKIFSYNISANVFSTIESFLSDRFLQVVVSEQSQTQSITAGMPQVFVLVPNFFLINLNICTPYKIYTVSINFKGCTPHEIYKVYIKEKKIALFIKYTKCS